MAGSVNKVILIGHLGADPEMRYTASGSPVANLRVATNESWTDGNGERQERTEWHRIVVWGKQAENAAQYLSKGKQLYLEGRLQTRQWDDREGHKRSTTEIVATTITFLGAKSGDAGPRSTGSAPDASAGDGGGFDYGPPPMNEDDVPF